MMEILLLFYILPLVIALILSAIYSTFRNKDNPWECMPMGVLASALPALNICFAIDVFFRICRDVVRIKIRRNYEFRRIKINIRRS